MSETKILNITTSAAEKVHNLKTQEQNMSLLLRISITGGGCHGFQYKFAFEDQSRDDDFSFSKSLADNSHNESVTIIIDPISLGYLRGSEVDYLHDAKGDRFIIRNPNASTTCGCDRSFTT